MASVFMFGKGHSMAAASKNANEVEGRIIKVEAVKEYFTMRFGDTHRIKVIHCDDHTKIYDGERHLHLRDLRPGRYVLVTYKKAGDERDRQMIGKAGAEEGQHVIATKVQMTH